MLFGTALGGCAASDGSLRDGPGQHATDANAAGGGGAGQGGASASVPAGTHSVTVSVGSGGSGSINLIPEVYAHSSDTLYKLDPITKQVTVVGELTGCPTSFGIIDIAVDKNHNIIGASGTVLWHIDKTTGSCTALGVGPSSYPNSLSFVPEGILDPDEEVLVGNRGSQYVRIDTTTGEVTVVGDLGQSFTSSGDIVSVNGGGSYLTVRGQGCADCLAEIDPKTGQIVKNWGDLGYDSVYGLAYWGGHAYGFSYSGTLFEIQFDSQSVTATPITIPSAPATLHFNGAGSSTVAPVMTPN